MDAKEQDRMIKEVARREREFQASFIPDAARDAWTEAATWTKGKRVHDIIDVDTVHGDDVLIWVFVPLLVGTPRQPDLVEGDEVVLMILYLEQHQQLASFKKGTFNGRFYEGPNGEHLVEAARQGSIV